MTPDVLFCPRCGRPLVLAAATRRCAFGDMELSISVNAKLEEDFGAGSGPRPSEPSPVRVGGRWFCPNDASLMAESGGIVGCPACGRALSRRLIYELIEYHVHRREEPAMDQDGDREYRAVVWSKDQRPAEGQRVTLRARTIDEARDRLKATYGSDTLISLWNEDDAARPR